MYHKSQHGVLQNLASKQLAVGRQKNKEQRLKTKDQVYHWLKAEPYADQFEGSLKLLYI